jgi:hypothetical protein
VCWDVNSDLKSETRNLTTSHVVIEEMAMDVEEMEEKVVVEVVVVVRAEGVGEDVMEGVVHG